MPKKCYFRPKNWHFLGKKNGFLVMVAPEPLISCSKTLQNALFWVQHPLNRIWSPTCDHSGPKNIVLGQKMAFFGHFWPKMRFFGDGGPNTIMPIADACFLSEAAQCQKYTLNDLVDHVDPKHTAAQQVVTIGACCYPMLGHLREKDTPYNP